MTALASSMTQLAASTYFPFRKEGRKWGTSLSFSLQKSQRERETHSFSHFLPQRKLTESTYAGDGRRMKTRAPPPDQECGATAALGSSPRKERVNNFLQLCRRGYKSKMSKCPNFESWKTESEICSSCANQIGLAVLPSRDITQLQFPPVQHLIMTFSKDKETFCLYFPALQDCLSFCN